MSLEARIDALNGNLSILIGLLQAGQSIASSAAAPASAPATPKSAPAAAAAPTPPPPVAEAATQPEPDAAITFEDVKKAVITISSRKGLGRDAAVNLLKEFGAQRAPDVKPEQYQAFVAKANELLAAHPAA